MQTILDISRVHAPVASALKYVLHYSTSVCAPYHNFYHTTCVAETAYDLAQTLCPQYSIELALAGLFHDFDHSQGRHPDNVNVSVALKAFASWYATYDGDINFEASVVQRCISVTEYPYTVSNEDLKNVGFLPGLIIRDADMVQCLQPNWIQQVIFGLGQEFQKDFFTMAEGQLAFFNSLSFHTVPCQELWAEKKSALMQSVRQLITYKEL